MKRGIDSEDNNSKPALSTPEKKTVINVIPPEEPNITPKRTRYSNVENDPNDLTGTTNKSNLAPPPSERPSLSQISEEPIKPTSLFTEAETPPIIKIQPPPAASTTNFNPMGTVQAPSTNSGLFSAPSTTSSLFSAPNLTFTSSLSQFSSQTQGMNNVLKYSQKFSKIFGCDSAVPGGEFKQELEKEKIIFENQSNLIRMEKIVHIEECRKDPHGLNWLAGAETKTSAKIPEKKKIEFDKIKKVQNLDSGHALEILLPKTRNQIMFYKSKQREEAYNSPSFSFDFDFEIEKNKKENIKPVFKNRIVLQPNYKTTPPIDVLNKLSEEELESVSNFSIENENGKISFKTPVNLLSVNFKTDLFINKGTILLYPNKPFPAEGTGFNLPATVSLFNCLSNKIIPVSDFIEVLSSLCKQFKSKFKSWNKKTGIWVFDVESFEMFK